MHTLESVAETRKGLESTFGPLPDFSDMDLSVYQTTFDHIPPYVDTRPWYRKRWEKVYFPVFRLIRSGYLIAVRSIWRATFSRWFYVKYERPHAVLLGEAAALRYVKQHTCVPVPRVWGPFTFLGDSFIVMERIHGVPSDSVWEKAFDEDSRGEVIRQLARYVDELRSLRSPFGEAVCSASQGPFFDCRMEMYGTIPSGPFRDEDDMNMYLSKTPPEDRVPDIAEAMSIRHPICFTHGDLAPRNILVRGTKIVALLDWESAGWWPSHWEYIKATFAPGVEPDTWIPWVQKFVPVYNKELNADLHLCYGPILHPVIYPPSRLRKGGGAERLQL